MPKPNSTSTLLPALGQVIRARRLELGFSQEEFAHQAQLHRTYVCDLEHGMRNPSICTVSRVACGLRIPAGELVRRAEQIEQGTHRVGQAAGEHHTH